MNFKFSNILNINKHIDFTNSCTEKKLLLLLLIVTVLALFLFEDSCWFREVLGILHFKYDMQVQHVKKKTIKSMTISTKYI